MILPLWHDCLVSDQLGACIIKLLHIIFVLRLNHPFSPFIPCSSTHRHLVICIIPSLVILYAVYFLSLHGILVFNLQDRVLGALMASVAPSVGCVRLNCFRLLPFLWLKSEYYDIRMKSLSLSLPPFILRFNHSFLYFLSEVKPKGSKLSSVFYGVRGSLILYLPFYLFR